MRETTIYGIVSDEVKNCVCHNCLHHYECQPSFSEGSQTLEVKVKGRCIGVSGKCLLSQEVGATRGPVYPFVETPEGNFVESLPESEPKKIYEIKDRKTLAVLCCLRCPVVSACEPDYSSDGSVIKVKGEKANSADCLLKKKLAKICFWIFNF